MGVGFDEERLIEIGRSWLIGSLWPCDRGEEVAVLVLSVDGNGRYVDHDHHHIFSVKKIIITSYHFHTHFYFYFWKKILPCDSFSWGCHAILAARLISNHH